MTYNPKPPTEAERGDALRLLRRDYWVDVQALADAVEEARDYARKHDEDFCESDCVHEVVDGSDRVIYTALARESLLFATDPDAWLNETGEAPQTVEQQAYGAIRKDVETVLDERRSGEPESEAV